MNFDPEKLRTWMQSKELYLPGIAALLTQSKAEILIIGAAVFELYEMQGWITPLKRRTSDIDLSIGLLEGDDDYTAAKATLATQNYRLDDTHPYRYHSPRKIPGGYTYIDLLAHPIAQSRSTHLAALTMGVGSGFNFNGFYLANKSSFSLINRVAFPNPFGLMALKRAGFLAEPTKRLKDFADIVELIDGLTETGTHFEMVELWNCLVKEAEADTTEIKSMLAHMRNQDAPKEWDFDSIRAELKSRNYDDNYIDGDLLQRVNDFDDLLRS
jgi:hypothetical protein